MAKDNKNKEKQEIDEFEKHTLVVIRRIDMIVNFILENPEYINTKRNAALFEAIDSFLKEKGVELSYRTITRHIQEAKKQVRELLKKNSQKKANKVLLHFWSIKQRAQKAGNLSDERLTLKEIAELEGLYPEKNVKVKGEISLKDINLNSLTDDQLTKLKTMLTKGVELKEALLHIGVIIK